MKQLRRLLKFWREAQSGFAPDTSWLKDDEHSARIWADRSARITALEGRK